MENKAFDIVDAWCNHEEKYLPVPNDCDYVAPDIWMTMKSELESVWKEVCVF